MNNWFFLNQNGNLTDANQTVTTIAMPNKSIQITQLGPLEYDVIRLDTTGLDGHVRLETPELSWVLDVFLNEQHEETIELGLNRPDWQKVINTMLHWRE